MNIFKEHPQCWIDLQNKVAHVLEACGYTVETPKTVKGARGDIEVDVYAHSPNELIVCECKYWSKKVSQDVIFSFRAVVNDVGANKGIIVAKNGFQRGAYKNAQHTNIELRTWEEFLGEYKDSYLKSHIKQFSKIKRRLYRVAMDKPEYWEYYDSLDETNRMRVGALKDSLRIIVFKMIPMCFMLQNEDDPELEWSTEYIDKLICDEKDPYGNSFLSYHDFFEYINEQTHRVVSEIELIYGIPIL